MIQQNDPITGRPVQNPYERYDHLRSEDPVPNKEIGLAGQLMAIT